MTNPTAIPEFIDALYSAAGAALAETVTVVDGPPLSWDPLNIPDPPGTVNEDAFLFIGAIPDDDTSADAAQDPNTMGTGSSEEIHIPCTVYFRDGDQVLKKVRDSAKASIAVLRQAISADQTLGGAVAKARLASVDRLDQRQTDEGCDCAVLFTVAGRAFLR